jgi:hypothetical protein
MPAVQTTTIAIDAGLTTPPMAVDGVSSAPIRTIETTRMTSIPSSTGVSAPTRNVSGRSRPAAMSQTTSTIVCTAIPPIRFPAARPRWPEAAAEIVMATSGRLPAIARRITPPNSSPRPSRTSSASVVFESPTPATHVKPAPAAKTITSHGVVSADIAHRRFADNLGVSCQAPVAVIIGGIHAISRRTRRAPGVSPQSQSAPHRS